jgi:hypothetical protein
MDLFPPEEFFDAPRLYRGKVGVQGKTILQLREDCVSCAEQRAVPFGRPFLATLRQEVTPA